MFLTLARLSWQFNRSFSDSLKDITKIIKLKITIKICEVIIIFPNSGFKKVKAMIIKVDLRNT